MTAEITNIGLREMKGVITISNVTSPQGERINITFRSGGNDAFANGDITILELSHEQFSLAITGVRQEIVARVARGDEK